MFEIANQYRSMQTPPEEYDVVVLGSGEAGIAVLRTRTLSETPGFLKALHPKPLTQGSSMKILLHSLVASSIVTLIASAGPNIASASETAARHRDQIGSTGSTIVLAEKTMRSKTSAKLTRHNVILKGYDPVAYFKQGKAVKGNPSIVSTYHGATYLFASKADKADFDKSPAKFEPQYGGFCANSMAKGRRKDIDPNVFYIYKGKLYVCETAAGLNEFRRSPDVNIAKADKNWLKIGPSTYNTETRDFERPWPFGPASNR
jgi:YHS domain-containing protein